MAVINPSDSDGPGPHIDALGPLDSIGAPHIPHFAHPQRPPRTPLMPTVPIRTALRVLLPALLIGFIADALFYGKQLGLSVPLLTSLITGTLFWVARHQRVSPIRRNLWILAPTLFFALMVAVRTNESLTALNLLAVGGLLCLLVTLFAYGKLEALGILGYPAAILSAFASSWVRPVPALAVTGRLAAQHRAKLRRAFPILRGALLALPLLALFTALLSSADSMFARYVGDVLEVDLFNTLPERLWRLTIILTVSWVLSGGLLVALRRATAPPLPADGVPLVTSVRLGFGETATILLLVDVLFAAFVWVQFAYLFSGEASRTMHFEDYRIYARRGFGELLAVSVMTLFLITGLRAVAWRLEWTSRLQASGRRHARLFNTLATTMIALTLAMLVSAFQRMALWESVEFYVNTGTRLYVRWFITWLAVAFLWLAATLWLRPNRFAIGGFIASLGFLITMNLQDPDADVARYNLARQDELSTRYISLLSDDAVPTLAAALVSPEQSASLPPAVRQRISDDLGGRLARYEHTPTGWDHWPSAHLSRWRAHQALLTLRTRGLI